MDVAFADRAAFLESSETLVLADLHLGRGASANVCLPLTEDDIPARLAALCEWFSPTEIVLAGDVLHAFSHLPEGARETFRRVEDIAEDAGAELVVTPGNHDAMLDSVWEGPSESEHRVGQTAILHGHDPPEIEDGDGIARYVVGHDHPAIRIEGHRRPCFLFGRNVYAHADVLMLPAFNRLAPGVVVNGTYSLQSPLVTDLGEFRPVIRDEEGDETLEFPPLGEFRSLL